MFDIDRSSREYGLWELQEPTVDILANVKITVSRQIGLPSPPTGIVYIFIF